MSELLVGLLVSNASGTIFIFTMNGSIEIHKIPFYKTVWFFISLAVLLIIVTLWTILKLLYPTTSPINTISYFIYAKQHPHIAMGKQIVAFMPYWRIGDVPYARLDLLSEINYFSLTTDGDGNFKTIVGNQTDPGWLQWNSQTVKDLIAKTQITGNAFSVTIANQRNKTIESLLNNKKAQKNLINNIIQLVNARHINGIVIDFEYDGKPYEKYRQGFTQFASLLSSALHKETPHVSLQLALLPSAGKVQGLFDLPKIANYFDTFIGMSYDYYTQASDTAGPVAPMNGFKENKYFYDVSTMYKDILVYIPKEKILMGIPYYGYDWAVTDGKKSQSKTLPADDPDNYAAVISYGRAREDKDIVQNQCRWDDYAQEPWCWYTDKNGIDHQIWFENNKSIEAKYTFARKNNLAGVAIWTMGYDKNYPDLWNIMKSVLAR